MYLKLWRNNYLTKQKDTREIYQRRVSSFIKKLPSQVRVMSKKTVWTTCLLKLDLNGWGVPPPIYLFPS